VIDTIINDAEYDHEEDDISEELSDTEESESSTNCEDEDRSNDETSESQILPAVNRNITHYALRQSP